MAQSDAMTDSFLAGQGIPVELGQVETRVGASSGDRRPSRRADRKLENPHVTRIALANLVVESFGGCGESLCGVLETVLARFPCRAIVVVRSDDPARRIAAEVSALCHLPAPGMPQVCSERILLRAGPNAIDLVPGAVRPLLEAELPMILWWTGDPRTHESLFRDLGDECSRLILDLPDPGAEIEAIRLGLDPTVCRFSRDVAWFGLTRWRELVAQFFDPPCPSEALGRIDSVHIEACRAKRAARRGSPSGWPPGSPVSSDGRPSAGPSRPPRRPGPSCRPNSSGRRGRSPSASRPGRARPHARQSPV